MVFNWDYLNLPSYVGVSNWKVFIPGNAVLGGYYAQAINKGAPHPAAARLWEEFLYSQATDGGQNLWLQGGARPVEEAAMTANGSIDKSAAAKLPPVSGTPLFLTEGQATSAANYLRLTGLRPSASRGGQCPSLRRPRPAPGPHGPGAGSRPGLAGDDSIPRLRRGVPALADRHPRR